MTLHSSDSLFCLFILLLIYSVWFDVRIEFDFDNFSANISVLLMYKPMLISLSAINYHTSVEINEVSCTSPYSYLIPTLELD